MLFSGGLCPYNGPVGGLRCDDTNFPKYHRISTTIIGAFLAKNVKNFFHRLQGLLEDVQEADRLDLYRELKAVRTFVITGMYMPRGTVTNLDQYLTKSDGEIAAIMGESPAGIRQKRNRYSKALYNAFGDDFFDVILFDDGANQIRTRLELATSTLDGKHRAEDYVVPELAVLGRSGSQHSTFTLRECEYEARMLERYSRSGLRNSVSSADADKLSFLLRVLEGSAGTPEEQLAFRKAISASKGFTQVDALRRAN